MLEITNLSFGYQTTQKTKRMVFENLELSVPSRSLIGIIGQNGCGKTTLLHLCAGITQPLQGMISLEGKPIQTARVSYLFQNDRESLLPWYCVRDNITFLSLVERTSRKAREKQAQKLCTQYGITLNLDQFPYELSGGQQQMVSLLRGFATCPDLLLLDEPFSSLDAIKHEEILTRFKEMWMQNRPTCLFVSHDVDELCSVAQYLLILGDTPTQLLAWMDLKNDADPPRMKKIILDMLHPKVSL